MKIADIISCLVFNIKALKTKVKSPKSHFGIKGRCARTGDFRCKGNGIIKADNFILRSNCHIEASGVIEIGDKTFFNYNCIVVARGAIKIGERCSFGPNVSIYDHDHKFGPRGQIHGEYNVGEIHIGNNVWCGANTIILRNTRIGNNCVIGAGSIIKGDIPDNSIVMSSKNTVVERLGRDTKNG